MNQLLPVFNPYESGIDGRQLSGKFIAACLHALSIMHARAIKDQEYLPIIDQQPGAS